MPGFTFTSTLSPGTTNPQVRELQKFLNASGYPVAASGQPGSSGMETDYFGPATQAALQKYQADNGIVSSGDPQSTGYGNFGPKTMASVNSKTSQASYSSQSSQSSQEQALANLTSAFSSPTNTPEQNAAIASVQQSFAPTSSTQNSDYSIRPTHVVTNPGGTASFSNGRDALVTFSGEGATPNQIFLIDQENKQVIPFSSMQSAINYFSTVTGGPVTADQINQSLTQIPTSTLGENGSLSGFQLITDPKHGFDENGHLTNPAPSNANMQARYGKDVNQNDEVKAYTALDGFIKLLNDAEVGSSISEQEMSAITSDDMKMAFYINALAYGGYSLQDVYKDMVRQNLVNKGQGSQVMNSYPISSSQTASTYKASPNYASVNNNPALQVSPTIEGIDSTILNNPVLSLPDSAFNLISPLSDPNSPEFRAQMEEYKDATYQVALEMSQSANESDHAKAMEDWQTLHDEIESRLGITLSNNAVQAWNQIDTFVAQAGQANLGGSGIVEQKIDEFLKQQSAVNKSMRSQYASYQDAAKEAYYQNYASPAEIAELVASDPQTAKAWGLIPTDAAKQYMTMSNLRTLFPDTPEEDLQALINKYLDPNGNNYSKLYANYAANQYDITGKQNVAASTAVMQESQNEATEALRKYSDPNNPFLRADTNTLPQSPTLPSTGTEKTPSAAKASEALRPAAEAAANLGTASTSKTTSQPAAPKTPSTPAPVYTPTISTPTSQEKALADLTSAFSSPTNTPEQNAAIASVQKSFTPAPAPTTPVPQTLSDFNQQMVNYSAPKTTTPSSSSSSSSSEYVYNKPYTQNGQTLYYSGPASGMPRGS